MRYSYEDWEEVVYQEFKNGYFKPKNGDRIICAQLKCPNCKYYQNGCPDIGVGTTKGLGLSEHKKTLFEFYPELFLSGKM